MKTGALGRIIPFIVGAILGTLSAAGCVTQRLPVAGREAPVQNVVRASQYAFTTDFELDSNDPVVQDLIGLRQAITQALEIQPGREPIRVVIFETQQRYHEFIGLNFPELPSRRAFFVKQNTDELAIFAFRGETLVEDLRHEATHALLHSALGDVPIWLDEGLACYFEVGPEAGGVNARHVVGLRSRTSGRMRLSLDDLRRLESLRNLWEMTAEDYRQSWLWAHFCLHHSAATREAMRRHLTVLGDRQTDSLADRLESLGLELSSEMELHLAGLADAIGDHPAASGDNYYQPTHSVWQSSLNATRQLLRPLEAPLR